jgi:hypothetical protein
VAAGGRRCSARKRLEFHHVHPYGAGGDASIGNIELRCRGHNAYEAELFYGVNPRNDRHGSSSGTMTDTVSSASPLGSTSDFSDLATEGQLAPGRVHREARP